jgi:hypothetical protein
MSLLLFAKKKFNPIRWFAKSEQGAWYDPSDLTTLFQDSTGITPVVTVGTVQDQPVGLMLDKSKGLALGAELVTNGDFSNGTTGWTAYNSTIANINSQLVVTAAAASPYIVTPFNTVAGTTYFVSFTIISRQQTGSIFAYVGSSPAALNLGFLNAGAALGTRTLMFVGTGATVYLTLSGSSTALAGDTTTYDNISVKQIAGNHAFQATSANRPILSSRVNLLTKTEDWSAVGGWRADANIAVAVTSEPAYSTLTKIGSSDAYTRQVITPAQTSYTFTLKIKKDTDISRFPEIYLDHSAINYTYINLNTFTGAKVIRAQGGVSNATVVDGGLTWNITLSITASTINLIEAGIRPAACTVIGVFNAAAVGSITIGYPDLRPTNAGALLPAYQRVNTASDYDSVGFPLYLKANGLQSAMSTNSIDFTSTDKMTVVTGVRKLSDSGIGMLLETSVSVSVNNGTFYLGAPGSSPDKYFYGGRGSGSLSQSAVTMAGAAPETKIVSGITSIPNNSNILRVNAIDAGYGSLSGTLGNFGNYPLYLFARNNGASYQFNGQFYGAIIRGAQSDTASVTQTENYMATKTGITF